MTEKQTDKETGEEKTSGGIDKCFICEVKSLLLFPTEFLIKFRGIVSQMERTTGQHSIKFKVLVMVQETHTEVFSFLRKFPGAVLK